MLVILEGLDNTGKTTIAKMLMQYYKIQGKNATLAKELSTPIGEQIKQLSKEGKLTPELKTYLFAADRRLLLDGLGQVNKDDIVIFDRYVPSAIAYRMADACIQDANFICEGPEVVLYKQASTQCGFFSNSGKVNINLKSSRDLAMPREALTETIGHEVGHAKWDEKTLLYFYKSVILFRFIFVRIQKSSELV